MIQQLRALLLLQRTWVWVPLWTLWLATEELHVTYSLPVSMGIQILYAAFFKEGIFYFSNDWSPEKAIDQKTKINPNVESESIKKGFVGQKKKCFLFSP